MLMWCLYRFGSFRGKPGKLSWRIQDRRQISFSHGLKGEFGMRTCRKKYMSEFPEYPGVSGW